MKTLVVYDSLFGNTAEIAEAIGSGIIDEVKVLPVAKVTASELDSLDLLIVGAPTQGGKASPPMRDFLKELSESAIEGISVAAFDTRLPWRFVKIFGFAAGKIAKNLKKRGGVLVLPAEAFYVAKGKGPLKDGELERATEWAKEVVKAIG